MGITAKNFGKNKSIFTKMENELAKEREAIKKENKKKDKKED